MTAAGTVVICLGNDLRGDDGAGLEVARLLRPRLPPHVALRESDGDPADIIDAWTGARLAIVVDAVTSDSAPGTIHHHTGLDAPATPRRSSHSLGLAEALALGQALNRLPATLTFFGIEATDLTLGTPLTPQAQAAAEKITETIIRTTPNPPPESGCAPWATSDGTTSATSPGPASPYLFPDPGEARSE